MAAYLVWFLLFTLFLIVIPFGISPFEVPKVIIAEGIIDLLLLIKLIHAKKIHLKRLFTSQTILLSIILLLSLDQILLFHPVGSFFGNQFRLQGLFLLWHLLAFSFVSKDINLTHIPKPFYYLSFVFLFLATLILGVNQNGRAFGSLGEPNALAATTLFMLPFVYFQDKKINKIVAMLVAFSIILLSGSRAGLIGFGVELAFIGLTNFLKVSALKSTIIALILILFSLTLPFADNFSVFENRGQIWQTALQAGLQSPFLGQGIGNIQKPIHKAAVKLNNPVQYQVVDSAHNFLLDWWIQAGAVGVISLLTLLFLSIQRLIKHKKVLEITALLGIITAMLFNPVSVVNLLAFWWLIGQGFSD